MVEGARPFTSLVSAHLLASFLRCSFEIPVKYMLRELGLTFLSGFTLSACQTSSLKLEAEQ